MRFINFFLGVVLGCVWISCVINLDEMNVLVFFFILINDLICGLLLGVLFF